MAEEEEGNLSLLRSKYNETASYEDSKLPYRDQFKATKLWHAIIEHLRNNVAIKCRRQLLRNYDDTFTGANAVDVVLQFLQEKASDIAYVNEELNRQNAVKVCQALLDRHVFEPTGTWRQRNVVLRKLAFEDSHCKLFRFVSLPPDTSTPEKDSSFTRALAWSALTSNRFTEPSEVVIANPLVCGEPTICATGHVFNGNIPSRFIKKEGAVPSPDIQNSSFGVNLHCHSRKRCGVAASKRSISVPPASLNPTSGAKTIKRNWATASLSSLMGRALKKKYRAKSLCDLTVSPTIWKQIALVRLLTLVDVPLLEDIIPVLQESENDTSVLLDLPKNAKCESDEQWLELAEKCTGCDRGIFQVDSPSKSFMKKAAFTRVVQSYSGPGSTVIPDCMKDVVISIFGLLQESKEATALQAIQLALLLFSKERRNKLYHLLHFMQILMDDTFRLSRKISNRQLVLQKLVPAVLRFPLLGIEQAAIFVFFLLEQHSIIFSPPDCLFADVESIVGHSYQVAHKSVVTFCQQISDELYKSQSEKESKLALHQLLQFGLIKNSLTSKARTKWIHKFRKHHPEVLTTELPSFT